MNDNIKTSFLNFEDWMTNQFWYHNKWYFLAAVFVAVLLLIAFVRSATRIEYDWQIAYLHNNTATANKSGDIVSYFKDRLPDVTENEKIDIEVLELTDNDDILTGFGEHSFFRTLDESYCYIILMDEDTHRLYSELGYFEELGTASNSRKTVYIDSLELYAAVNKSAPLQYTMEDVSNDGISEEELTRLNSNLIELHNYLADTARGVLSVIAAAQ